MLKRIGLILITLMILTNFVYAQSEEKIDELNNKIDIISIRIETIASIISSFEEKQETQSVQINEINAKVDTLETKEDSVSSFSQLQNFINYKVESLIPLFIIILI